MDAYAAHADAAEVEGALRGGAARFRGLRVSSSGLPAPQWNTADVRAPDADLDAARAFFGDLPWGMRVPVALPWTTGRRRLRQPLMACAALRDVAAVPDLTIREARPEDLEAVLAIDAEAFASDAEAQRPWTAPHIGAAGIEVAFAALAGEPVATAYAVRSNGEAGPAVLLAGVAVVEAARRRGIGAAVSAWLLARAFSAGAAFAHLHADTPAAARVYARLGFADAGALDIYEE
jgi:predicted GNAT family acetyltransferase